MKLEGAILPKDSTVAYRLLIDTTTDELSILSPENTTPSDIFRVLKNRECSIVGQEGFTEALERVRKRWAETHILNTLQELAQKLGIEVSYRYNGEFWKVQAGNETTDCADAYCILVFLAEQILKEVRQ